MRKARVTRRLFGNQGNKLRVTQALDAYLEKNWIEIRNAKSADAFSKCKYLTRLR